MILSHACLPIPAFPHSSDVNTPFSNCLSIVALSLSIVNSFFEIIAGTHKGCSRNVPRHLLIGICSGKIRGNFQNLQCVGRIQQTISVHIRSLKLILCQDNQLRHALQNQKRIRRIDNVVAVHVSGPV